MHSKPVIFISAVSGEFRTARDVVAKALVALGYEPKWQDIAPAEHGSLRGVLRKWIDHSVGVLQILGQRYGAEPAAPDPEFGRCSYTQYEAHYARQRGRKVWYLFADDTFLRDPADPESPELAELQTRYLVQVKAGGDTRHRFTNPLELENTVLRLRDDLAPLRRRGRQWAAAVLALLVLVAGGIAWVLQGQRHSAQELDLLKTEIRKVREALNALPGAQAQALRQQPGQKLGEADDDTYEVLEKQLGIGKEKLRVEVPALARRLQAAPDTAPLERANAAYVTKDYAQAETLALRAAHAALGVAPPRTAEALQAYELAGQAAEQRIHYQDALHHLREAERLTDRQRDGKEWARVQFALARVMDADGDYRAAGTLFQEVVKEQTAALGPNDPVTLLSRIWFGVAMIKQGQIGEAERELHAVLELETRVQGAEHPDSLKARHAWANVLFLRGRYHEAENEYRAVLAIRERTLGPEHPDTLTSRSDLAIALRAQGDYAAAEREHREVLAIRERVLGPKHRDTLKSRSNWAVVLDDQARHAEAQHEYEAVRAVFERVLGPEHPDTLKSRNNVASALYHQKKYPEAEREHRAVQAIIARTLGPEHPDILRSRDNLAVVLSAQGRHAEAEAECRAVIGIGERVLGREHPDVLRFYYNLAVALEGQRKYDEALDFARRAEEGRLKILEPEHPASKAAKALREKIEAEIGEQKAK